MEKHAFSETTPIGGVVTRQINKVLNGYFPFLGEKLESLTEHRKRPEYSMQEIVMSSITMFMFKEGSRNAYNNERKDENFCANYNKLFGLKLAHMDTVTDAFMSLPVTELETVKHDMIRALIAKKVFKDQRFMGRYLIAIDATRTISFNYKHCDCCLHTTSKNGKKRYFHNVLEAKLITPSGMAIPFVTEWISNDGKTGFDKQDCERNAFVRIAKKIRGLFPQLPITILADGLYPYQGFFDICEQYDWKYIVTLKDDSLKTLQQDINWEKRYHYKQTTDLYTVRNKNKIKATYQWLTNLKYNEHYLNWVECLETRIDTNNKEYFQRFVHLTNFDLNMESCSSVSDAGRLRQKIENEGFNIQKNQGYNLEHKYVRKSFSALQNFYQAMQIAHLINQLVEKTKDIAVKLIKDKKLTVKYLWKRLLSYLTDNTVNEQELIKQQSSTFQIRLI